MDGGGRNSFPVPVVADYWKIVLAVVLLLALGRREFS